ncbi:MAG TPA: EVE domain-containing protein [Myxococcales bacterium]|nr:EVE domain-containing protein [Myxococcales bacterium]
MRHWLLKTEPGVFSFDDLLQAPKQTTGWNGIRNYQARNFLRDQMEEGDRVLIYHSSADPPAVAGLAEVVRAGYPDPTQFDAKDDHYDPESTPAAPRWYQVDVKAVRKLPRAVSLEEIRRTKALAKMPLVQRGQRLSVQPVGTEEYELIVRMGSK